jgi:hypothetical protein
MPRMPLDPSSSRISQEQFAKFFGIPREHSLRCSPQIANEFDRGRPGLS